MAADTGEHLDDIDHILLRELVADGRATLAHLATTAGLSVSAVQSRVRRLEARGIVTGYTARIDNATLGQMLSAFVAITPLDPSQPDDAPARLEHIEAIESPAGLGGGRGKLHPDGARRLSAGTRRAAEGDPWTGERATRSTIMFQTFFTKGGTVFHNFSCYQRSLRHLIG